MTREGGSSWQVILADLSLILFLVSLAGFSLTGEVPATVRNPASPPAAIAPSQALYRRVPDGPGLDEWLAAQPVDPRATLTIFVRFNGNDGETPWNAAARMLEEAESAKARVRVIMERGDRSDIYASLAFDGGDGI